jgi:hypothetical protein
MTIEERISLYKTYMDKVKRVGKDEFVTWLINETDYFTAPASAKFHCNYEGGLFDHSMNVLNYARNLYVFSKKNYPNFPDISAESIIISTLHHDLCKVNFYGKEKAWVKHEYNWVEYETYKAGSEDSFPFGHGEKSVVEMLRHGFTDLTEQEMLAIRHHMGKFGGDINTDIAMNDPLVKLVHLSDSASSLVEVTIDYKEIALQEHIRKINGN